MLRDEFGREAIVDPSCSKPPITTAVLCGNVLLKAGFSQLLSQTRFAVADLEVGLGPTAPEMLIVDAGGSLQQTLDFVHNAKGHHPSARVVLVAERFDIALITAAVSAGVDSFCLTTRGHEVLLKVLELTILGEKVLPGTVLQSILYHTHSLAGEGQVVSSNEHTSADPRMNKLSPRETVILQSLMGGEANKVIARKLDITEATIKVHVKSILRKIGAANRTQAAMWANENLRETDRPVLSS
ncbi:LuxR C-terminal-related transcriptional regulator [Microvirga soli]|uniref:LuxR C-terminal-related transcriptional regulator n=1 Tax=Microvirga soli TaxID=1854496 RepID=UPI001FEBDFE1|nr:response regulator transcription factor [Microvirga soli]